MNTYALLLRGINVGGKNKILMVELKLFLEDLGFHNVTTYIQSGNVILQSALEAKSVSQKVEDELPKKFKLDSSIIKILVLSRGTFKAIIDNKPSGFGEQPEKYHSDAIFLMGIDTPQAMSVFNPREGVDNVWPGEGVIYSQRLSSERTKSRLSKIIGTPVHQSMTIRSWGTTTKLFAILEEMDQ